MINKLTKSNSKINITMTIRQRLGLVAGLLSIVLCSALASGQEVSITGERPVQKAIEKLEDLYRMSITYEDTLYMNAGDFVDVTAEVRLDHDGSNPNRVLVPTRRTITFPLSETAIGKTKSSQERKAAALAALKTMIDSDALAGGNGGFTVNEDAAGLHVISRAFRDASGQSESMRPILEIPVWITLQRQPALDVIEQICQQVSLRGRLPLGVGIVPLNLLANSLVSVDANNATARDVLENISQQIGITLSWDLRCDPREGECALNMHVPPE
jgi:hypothetical protein